ncbi:MAG: glycoside hydrolase family 16 protein [Paludibacter sp.]|nr:glycoside hydrolase family 16 protein [Paludibacter sp.]
MKYLKKNSISFIFLLLTFELFSQSKNDYKLIWQDNFNGKILDTTSWNHEIRAPRWVNNELQRYTNGENIKLAKGKLFIEACNTNGEYTSGRINTHDKRIFTYGIFEIKAKLPSGTGTWPALWMLGNNIDLVGWPACGELDIMEHVGKNPNFIHASIHNPSGYAATPYSGVIEIEKPFEKFHVYSMEWTKDFVNFYVDGKSVYRYQPTVKNEKNWTFDKSFFFIFNIAIGGDWGGPAVDDNCFPTTMVVDWVKVYQRKYK